MITHKSLYDAATQVHPKNWYPIPLIFCKPWGILPFDVPCHPKLADFANCMKKKGRGMSIFVSILQGDYKTRAEDARQVYYPKQLIDYFVTVPTCAKLGNLFLFNPRHAGY